MRSGRGRVGHRIMTSRLRHGFSSRCCAGVWAGGKTIVAAHAAATGGAEGAGESACWSASRERTKGKARQGKARQGKARQGKARQGKQGKARRANTKAVLSLCLGLTVEPSTATYLLLRLLCHPFQTVETSIAPYRRPRFRRYHRPRLITTRGSTGIVGCDDAFG